MALSLLLNMDFKGRCVYQRFLNKLIKQHDLPQIVFHSFRHMSVTYKLKLNGGDIKAVQEILVMHRQIWLQKYIRIS